MRHNRRAAPRLVKLVLAVTVTAGLLALGLVALRVPFGPTSPAGRADASASPPAGSAGVAGATGLPSTAWVAMSNPFRGASLYVDPSGPAARAAAAIRGRDPTTAALFDMVARQPQADWLVDPLPDEAQTAQVAARLAAITAVGALPLFVAYAIPKRDCGSYSAGGSPDAAAYRSWIRAVATGIGTARAVVILEPDALPQLSCLPDDQHQERLDLLRDAIGVLVASGTVAVYVDAGNSHYRSVATMSGRLRSVGAERARGFALNVSNFWSTQEQVRYAEQLSRALGGGHAVIDTSRNGPGPLLSGERVWCNPPNRALGAPPTGETGSDVVDAYLWVKHPGLSDGPCERGEPAAGTWWGQYARGLAERAQ